MRHSIGALALAATLIVGCGQIASLQHQTNEQKAMASRGGAYLLLDVDATLLGEDRLDPLSERMAEALRTATPAIRYNGRGALNGVARIHLENAADSPRALPLLTQAAGAEFAVTQTADGYIEARLTDSARANILRQAAEQTVTVLERRLNVPDIMVEHLDNGRISIHAGPRVGDPAQLRALVGMQGLLSFHLVHEMNSEDGAAGRIPHGAVIAPPYPGVGTSSEVVDERPLITGEHIASADPSTDSQTGEIVLSFSFDTIGTRQFCRVTTQHTHERFAVLLDGQVLTAPTINERICGGRGQISGNFTPETARELAQTIVAGAIPAPLVVVAQGTNYGR